MKRKSEMRIVVRVANEEKKKRGINKLLSRARPSPFIEGTDRRSHSQCQI